MSSSSSQHRWETFGNEKICVLPSGAINPIDVAHEIARQRATIDSYEPFGVLNCRRIIELYDEWRTQMPRVHPHYAVKCNDDPAIVRTLALLGAGFDCASEYEMKMVNQMGIVNANEKIVFANSIKFPSHVRYARRIGVKRMTVDSEEELFQIAKHFPDAELIVRIYVRNSIARIIFTSKFGAEPLDEAPRIMRTAKALGLNIIGVSFHVGSGDVPATGYEGVIADSRRLFDYGATLGYAMSLLDIGGGFPGVDADGEASFAELACAINMSLDKHFPVGCGVEIIAEPGRYFATSLVTLAACVYAVKRVDESRITSQHAHESEEQKDGYLYYVSDGLFQTYSSILWPDYKPSAQPLLPADDARLDENGTPIELFAATLYGPTCHPKDEIQKVAMLPKLNVGDWVYFPHYGAYSTSIISSFNGFNGAEVFRFMDESTWQALSSALAIVDARRELASTAISSSSAARRFSHVIQARRRSSACAIDEDGKLSVFKSHPAALPRRSIGHA